MALREQVRRIERPTAVAHGVWPIGLAAIDRALPGGGLARGALHDVFGAGSDEEDGALPAAFTAVVLARLGPLPSPHPQVEEGMGGGIILWCLPRADLYGLGLVALGLDPQRLVLVRTAGDAETLWAMEEGLRTADVTAVVGEIGVLPDVAGRRLQLAAERSGVTAFVLRRWRNAAEATRERGRPSAAATRWRIAALPSRPIPLPSVGAVSLPRMLQGAPSAPLSMRQAFGAVPKPPHPEEAAHGSGLRPARGQAPRPSRRIYAVDAFAAPLTEPGVGYPRWRVELLRCRGVEPASWDVELRQGKIADATDTLSLATILADRPAALGGAAAPSPQRLTG